MTHTKLMASSEFLQRFKAVLLAAWFLPLAFSFFIVGFLGDHAALVLMNTLSHAVSFYTVAGIATGYVILQRHMQGTAELASTGDAIARQDAEVRIRKFPYLFAGLFTIYALASPVVVGWSIAAQTGSAVTIGAYLFSMMGIVPPTAVTVLMTLYVFSDLVGQYFGPRGFTAHFFSLRMKVFALGVVMPLVVNTGLILYFGYRMGDLGLELFTLWAGLVAVSLPVAYFAQASFNKSFAPLKKLRAQALNVLDDLDAIVDPVPVSLDEFGDVTRDWASLTGRMTDFWRDLNNTTEHYRTLINAIDEPIAIVDFDCRAVYLGPAFRELLGTDPATFVGQYLTDLVHDEDLKQFRGLAQEAVASLEQRPEGQVRMRHPDGTYHRFLCSWRLIKKISGDQALFVSMRDISQQLTAQERLRAGEIRLRTMMQSVDDGILSIDQNGVVQSVNPAAANVFGYEGDELVGSGVGVLFPPSMTLAFPHSEVLQARAQGIDKLVGQGPLEMQGRHKDGSSFPMELAVTEMRIADERFFVAVVRDISSRKKSEEHLQKALEAAETANRTKSLFLANMSHELRTPLNAIIGFSEVMKDQMFGPVENERYLDYIGSIHDSSRHLLAVINDILDISRIESGELELDEEWFDVDDVLTWVRDRAVSKDAKSSHAPVWINISDDLPELYADQRSMRQVVLNLLSNAIKFTPVEGRIDISARLDELSGISIFVKDTGIGIPADQVEKMTLPFTQSDNSLARRFEGTGLGLAITKSLVEAHGGRLEIGSVEGKGTTICVRMPFSRVWSEAAEAAIAQKSLH